MGLFDEYGRRIPFPGMRVHSQVSRRYFRLNQPKIDFHEIYGRDAEHMELSDLPFSAQQFEDACGAILESLRSDRAVANITKGIHVPFICPLKDPEVGRGEELRRFVKAVKSSFEARFPQYQFYNLCEGLPVDDVGLAEGSRYERFEEVRQQGTVVGWYFANCLNEFDIASQRRQMASLPEQFVLSGGVEAAAALVGCPDLLLNKEAYPHHLCLSALEDPDERFFYSFEAYGLNLVFKRRSNMLTPTVKQLSEQFAGGLTVFTVFR